jgi:hypothetical protein
MRTALLVLGLAPSIAAAESATSTLTLQAEVESSITFSIEAAGGTTSGLGSPDATAALGTVSRFSGAPSGFNLSRGASEWTLSSSIGVKVVLSNLTSLDYTLTGQLQAAPPAGVTWKVGGVTLGDVAPATLTATAQYLVTQTFSWQIVVDNDASDGSIGNTIAFTAIAN